MTNQNRKYVFWIGLGVATVMVAAFSFWIKSMAPEPHPVDAEVAPLQGESSAGQLQAQQQPQVQVSPVMAQSASPIIEAQVKGETLEQIKGRNTWEKRFRNSEVVSERFYSQTGAEGTEVVRLVLIKTDFKYPMIRVKETWLPGPPAQSASQQYMVADHILMQLPPSVTFAEFESRVKALGAIAVHAQPTSGVYRVQFEPGQLDEFLNAVKNEWPGVVADPDYIRFVR